MAKVVPLKKDKPPAKRQKEAKSISKMVSSLKVAKLSAKKLKIKGNDATKKKSEKKVAALKKSDEKKEPKKKISKEVKPEKTSKTTVADGEKKKIRKRIIVKKNKELPVPAKIRKVLSVRTDGNKLVNGNAATPVIRTPIIQKIEISPQPAKPVSNGVPSSGSVSINSKAVIPKNKVIPGAAVKKDTPVPAKKIPCVEKAPRPTKPHVNKHSVIPNKTVLKTGRNLLNAAKKRSEAAKSSVKKVQVTIPKEQKHRVLNCQKLPKIPCRVISKTNKVSKPSLKTKVIVRPKNQCPSRKPDGTAISKTVVRKPIIVKPCKQLVCVSSKAPSSKNHDVEIKKPKLPAAVSKKPEVEEKAIALRDPAKVHPQRMASLNAMAKLHVICTTDRRVPVEVPKAAAPKISESSHVRSDSRKIQVGIKKEIHEIKGRVIHSRINCIKFEESSVTEATENVRTFCSISQEQEQTLSKRPKGRPKVKRPACDQMLCKSADKCLKKSTKLSPKEHEEVKSSIKRETKSTKIQKILTVEKTVKKTKKKEDAKSDKTTPNHKIDKKKVKVKATIRLRKTCTFQSVTTVSSHKTVNSLVSSCSSLGMTTNFERKKSVVRDESREQKNDLRIEELQEPFLPALEGPCTVPVTSNFCDHNLHQNPPHSVIPLAHSQSCHKLPTAERFGEPRPVLYDGNIPAHHCSHKEPVVYHRLAHSCGCCCSSSLVQPMHGNCALPKETASCAAHSSCCRVNTLKCTACSCCHSSASVDHDHRLNSPSSNFANRCCLCHSSAVHAKVTCSCCPATVRPCSSVPFDPIPLDLSLGASTAVPADKTVGQSRTICQTLHHCQDRLRFQSCPHSCQFNHCVLAPSLCSSYFNQSSGVKDQEKSQPLQISVIDNQSSTDPVPILESISSFSSDETTTNLICQEISTVRNYSCSSKPDRASCVRNNVAKKRKFVHGWSWEGEPVEKMIALTNDSVPTPKRCYPALRHKEGDIIKERDCVLLKSGPKDTDLPYVAKVAAFWENPDDGEMMMSLLWYYRPEHTEHGRRAGQMDDEVFASKHRDVNSVACIEDKCFVLTFNEYCRYRANLATLEPNSCTQVALTVPELASGYPRQYRLPPERVSPDMIFFCRHVYDFRQKRILKNPT